MVSPFDFAWALLKADDNDRPAANPWYSSENRSYDPDRTQERMGGISHDPEPEEYPPDEHGIDTTESDFEEMAPPPEEAESAMAPDDKAQQVLASLSQEEQDALHRLLMGGGGQ